MTRRVLPKGLLAFGVAVMMLLAIGACGDPEPLSAPAVDATPPEPTATSPRSTAAPPEPTVIPPQPTATPPLFAPAVPGWPSDAPADSSSGFPAPAYYDAANPSVNEQIYESDAVVRARLTSATNDVLRFRVVEYLKGSGPSEIAISSPTAGRDTTYDDLDAILFLSTPESPAGGASGDSGNTAAFEFTESIFETYRGAFPTGYGVNNKDRAWMPATSSGGASGQSGDSDTTEFDPGAPAPGRVHEEPLTVADIKTTIAWMTSDTSELYQHCIFRAVHNEAYFRNYSAYYGTDYQAESEKELLSSSPAGHVLWPGENRRGPQYGRYWVEGDDAALFSRSYQDDDTNPANGYDVPFAIKRPLPAGTYSVTTRGIKGEFFACNYTPEFGGRIDFTINVMVPAGVLHEALFDPVTLAAGVGADGSNGVLTPTGFSVNGSSTSITGLRWESNSVVLTLSPHVSLSGQRLDFIALDGSVALSLPVSSAMEDSAVGTLTWSMAKQPWVAGDLVMLRIRQE